MLPPSYPKALAPSAPTRAVKKAMPIVAHTGSRFANASLISLISQAKSLMVPSLRCPSLNKVLICSSKRAIASSDNSHLPSEISTFAKQSWWKNGGGPDLSNLRDEPLDPRTDGKLYSDCYADAWVASHGTDAGFVASPYLTAALEHHRLEPRSVLKIYSGSEFAGVLDLDAERGRHAGYGWITLLYLRPEFRGRNLGVQLLGRAVSFYETMGRGAIRLHAASDNPGAVAFYKKNGFNVINVESGILADLLLMEKSLV